MPFNANVPQAADQLSQSQADILGNFQAIATALDLTVNAVGIKFPRDIAVPPTAATAVGLYGSDSLLAPGTTAIFFREQNNGASHEMTTSVQAVNGWTCLPSGLILQWGIGSAPGGNPGYTQPLPIAFPHNFFAVVATPRTPPAGFNTDVIINSYVNGAILNSFRVDRKSHFGTAADFSFFAIGN